MQSTTLAAAVLFSLSVCATARADDGCARAIIAAEQENADLPARILHAISVVESGRRDPLTGQSGAWPWSVNAAGDSHFFDTRGEAIAFVRDAQGRGIRSIDVGCMQVNLMYHPNAFDSLEEAFAPEANVRFAAAFLLDLRQRTGDWPTATGHYHSATPGISEDYARRVQAIRTGQPPDSMPPARPSTLGQAINLGRLPPVSRTSAARGVQVIEPGTDPVRRTWLREAVNLPRVYHP